MRYVIAAAGTLVLLVAVVLGLSLRDQPVAVPTPVVFTSGAPAPSASPTASPLPPGSFENAILGYRVTLTDKYRRSASTIFTSQAADSQTQMLGRDTYTFLTEAQEREACLRDLGDIPSPDSAAYVLVEAYGNAARTSTAEWIRARPQFSTHRTVEPAALGGRDAVRLVQQGETQIYAIGANDRIYLITPTMWPSQHRLDDIAASFTSFVPQPFPTPTPTSSVPVGAARKAAAKALAAAFASRDAEAVARLMPQCHIGVVPFIGSVPQGSALNRSVTLFVAALRDRFARGDLTVTVDPEVQVQVQGGTERFFVRSEWREPDRTTKIDLVLGELDGRWQWMGAIHYYPSLVGQGCIPYRSPWVPPTSTC